MDRRVFVAGGIAALATPFAADAQQATRTKQIGWLALVPQPRLRAEFQRGMRDLGHIEGSTYTLHERYAKEADRLPVLAVAAVFVAALAVPLDDPALLGASMLVFRSGRMLVDTEVVEIPGTRDALLACMGPKEDDANDLHHRSKRLADSSRQRLRSAKDHMDATRQRLDRVRNALQLRWLRRALRDRLRNRDEGQQ
jgi:hypothetical protein